VKAAERRHASATRRSARVRLSSANAAADSSWTGVVAVEQPWVRTESELFEPSLKGGPVDTNEVPTIAADHRKARLVRPLIQDFLADLA
jgi:hypothetical protein